MTTARQSCLSLSPCIGSVLSAVGEDGFLLRKRAIIETVNDELKNIAQVVLSAISSVSKRIKEVAQTHKPLFAGELFLTGKEVCEWLYISPRTLQDYRNRRIIPYTQFAGKILYKTSDLERLLEDNYKE